MKPSTPPHTENWFILAHCFNMDGRAASQTITDRLPFLMAAGIRPVVLSAPTGDRDDRFPHFQVFSPAPSGMLFELRHIIKKKTASRVSEKLLKALLTLVCLPFLIIEKLLIQLDSQWSWCLSATLWGIFIARRYRPEIIYSTAGPPSTHAAGYFLHRLLKRPWLAELHDPLIYDDERPRWHNYWFRRWIEKATLANAAAVVYFTEKALESASRRHPIRGAALILRPGSEKPDLGTLAYTRGPRLRFGHFGSLAEDRNLACIVEALHTILHNRPGLHDKLRLDVYGAQPDPVTLAALEQFPLGDVFCPHGRLEFDAGTGKSGRQQVLEAMRCSDVLLLMHGRDSDSLEYIPSKLYEYLLMDRPILGFAARGSELETLLTRAGHALVDEGDPAAVQAALLTLIQTWETDGLPDVAYRSPFTVNRAVEKLLEVAGRIKREHSEG